MNTPHFLILIEGENDVKDLKNDKIELNTSNDISKIVKNLVKQLKRSQYCNNYIESSPDILEENFQYLIQYYGEDDYFYYLENQSEIYDKSFFKDSKIVLASFLLCIFKNIIDWVQNEEEE